MTDILSRLNRNPAWARSVGDITPDKVQAASDANPRVAEQLEAILLLGAPLITVTMAYAIILAVEAEHPAAEALRIAKQAIDRGHL